MIPIHMTVSGEYCLQVRKKTGEVVKDTGFFKNLITNQGLDNICGSNSALRYMSVGTGTTAPAVTDTQLVNLRAVADIGNTGNTSITSLDTTNNYLITTLTASFLNGSASGNISEVGVGAVSNGTLLTSRALVRDANGDPTTITVLSDEDLVVIYKFKVKQPTGDFTGVVGGYNYTMRACKTTTLSSSDGWDISPGYSPTLSLNTLPYYWRHTVIGTLGSITGGLSSSLSGAGATVSSVSKAGYVAGSFQVTCYVTLGTSSSDLILKGQEVQLGFTRWQIEFTPTISKLSIQTLRLGYTLTLGREV